MPVTQFILNKDSESVIEYTFLDGSVYLFFIFFHISSDTKRKSSFECSSARTAFFFCLFCFLFLQEHLNK